MFNSRRLIPDIKLITYANFVFLVNCKHGRKRQLVYLLIYTRGGERCRGSELGDVRVLTISLTHKNWDNSQMFLCQQCNKNQNIVYQFYD